MKVPEIIWTGTNDDFTAICGDYMLRAERMDKRKWWYCVYIGSYQFACDITAKTETEAKQAAEIEFYKHYISQI